jgi:anti-sigma factor RsiW
MSDTDALLVAYVDGELDVEASLEVEKLIAADPRAQRAVELYRETAGLLRAACGEHAYAANVERLLPALPSVLRRAPRRYGWAVGAALAACVAGFVGGAGWAGWPASEQATLADEVAEYHAVYAREERHLVEVPAEQMDDITSWLGKRLDRRLEVPDLAAEGLHFAGARMLVVGGNPVAQLIYTRAQGRPLALCIAKLGATAAPVRLEQHGEQRTALWLDGTYAYVVVGEVGEDKLRAIAEQAARQLQS